ncbi:hypothetical protein N5J06_03910 [Ralstonia sp. CHL-2022]|uniref:Uncharacterized protein n=1 Tax=Ralstonia mojiangensis TaxID=2953895 RepID=A0ABT2L3U0_9RALS|nr:hypothetical protein [Ralstonia mojiangensis]MCT7310075.1 hypothetical protein [Ralstonia mojiangensis]
MTRVHERSLGGLSASAVSPESFLHNQASGLDVPTCLPFGKGPNRVPILFSVNGKPQVQSASAVAGQSHHERRSGSCRIAVKAMHRPGLYQRQDVLLRSVRFS